MTVHGVAAVVEAVATNAMVERPLHLAPGITVSRTKTVAILVINAVVAVEEVAVVAMAAAVEVVDTVAMKEPTIATAVVVVAAAEAEAVVAVAAAVAATVVATVEATAPAVAPAIGGMSKVIISALENRESHFQLVNGKLNRK